MSDTTVNPTSTTTQPQAATQPQGDFFSQLGAAIGSLLNNSMGTGNPVSLMSMFKGLLDKK